MGGFSGRCQVWKLLWLCGSKQATGLVGLEGATRLLRPLRLHRPLVAHPVASKVTVQSGPRNMRVGELAHHGNQVVEWKDKRLAQRDRDGLLRRSL